MKRPYFRPLSLQLYTPKYSMPPPGGNRSFPGRGRLQRLKPQIHRLFRFGSAHSLVHGRHPTGIGDRRPAARTLTADSCILQVPGLPPDVPRRPRTPLIVDGVTGKRGIRVWMRTPRWAGPQRFAVQVGYDEHELSGGWWRCTMRKRSGAWEVAGCQLLGVA